MTHSERVTASLVLALTAGLSGCAGVQGTATGEGRPVAREACSLAKDTARIVLSDNGSGRDADVLDRSVTKAVRAAHRASEANPDYRGVYEAAQVTRRAVDSGDSRELTRAIRGTLRECGKALGSSFKPNVRS